MFSGMAVGAIACSRTNEEVIIVLFNVCTKETECVHIIGNFILMVVKDSANKQKKLTVYTLWRYLQVRSSSTKTKKKNI